MQPFVQSKLSHALHAHRRAKLLEDLQNQETIATKITIIRSLWTRQKGATMVCLCGMLGDLARRYDVGLVGKEGLIGRSLELHDRTESIGSVCYSNCHRNLPPPASTISRAERRQGVPRPMNRVLREALTKFWGESQV